MQKHINFGEIKQFRNVVKDITRVSRYAGLDTNGKAIYNNHKLPRITVHGTEKIHGTNASVCFNTVDGFWVQSRSQILNTKNDNAGCCAAASDSERVWVGIIAALAHKHNIDLDTHTISVFYEWCGGNIQKKTAVTGLDKRAIIFREFKVSPIDGGDSVWLDTFGADSQEDNIFNICNYKTHRFVIDFNTPLLSVNAILKEVQAIEVDSPVGSAMGVSGNVGEGIVVTFWYEDSLYRFKVKGEKHSNTKVKTLKPVDQAKEQAKIDFANYACSADRLEQAWQTVFGLENQEPDIKFTGDFLRAVIKDVMKEEVDILQDKGLIPKDVNATISKISRIWFMDQLDSFYGLKG